MRSFLELPAADKVLRNKSFTAVVACRRYWKHNIKTVRRLGTKAGGQYHEGIHFRYQGGQVRSLFSLLSYLGTGEYRAKFHGVKIPPTNLQDYHLQQARTFAGTLADRLVGVGETSPSLRGRPKTARFRAGLVDPLSPPPRRGWSLRVFDRCAPHASSPC